MDSQHRHDLKENDLEQFLRNSRQTWEKHGTTILVVILIVVLIFTGYRWLNRRSTDLHNTQWRDLAAASTPEAFQEVARSHDDPTVHSLALLYKGNLLLEKAAVPQHEGLTPESAPVDPAQREKDLETAAEAYKSALAGRDAPALIRMHATMGLATVAENKKQWDEARAKWKEVISMAGDKYAAIAAQAKGRLAFMDRMTQPVVFAPEPKPAPTPPALLTPNKPEGTETPDKPATPGTSDNPEKKPDAPATPDATKPDASKPAPQSPEKSPEKPADKPADDGAKKPSDQPDPTQKPDAPKAPDASGSPDAPKKPAADAGKGADAPPPPAPDGKP